MKLNKKVVESAAVLGLGLVLTITTITSTAIPEVETNTEETNEKVVVGTGLENNGTAGLTATLCDYQHSVSVEENAGVVVAAAESDDVADETTDEVSEEKTTEDEWEDNLMADVDESLYVRADADSDAKIVGKLFKGDVATIIEEGDDWTKIESGNVTGYVSNEYCVTGSEALDYAEDTCDTVATVSTDLLRIREKQSTDSKAVDAVGKGTELVVDTDAKTKDGWVAVKYESQTRYVSEEYVKVELSTGEGMTLEEEAAKIKAEEEAKAKAAAEAAAKTSSSTSGSSSSQTKSTTTQGSSVSSSTDEVTLLAALIQCEAGGESYNCQLAVGAVVVNRVKSGSYPNSIYKVIYQGGQFGPASSGRLASRLKSGISSTSRKAAAAALAGTDNTGGAKYFRLAKSGHSGVKIGALVFY